MGRKYLVAMDLGQAEHRVLAMASKDKATYRALWEGYDVHEHWTQRAIDLHPPWFEKHGGVFKSARGAIKNQLVFPAFYGASENSIAGYLDYPERECHRLFEEFWREHAGIKTWQKSLARFYERHGYVECLTGRRRGGPLSYNMILNTPIQGTASDIVVDAMDRITEAAVAERCWWFVPRLNIHDDLTWIMDEADLEEGIARGAEMMLDTPFDFVDVPLTVEVEIGTNWAEMEPIGTFSSLDLPNPPTPPQWLRAA